MKQSLQLRLGQTLTMTPQLQQAIRLLQISTLDLQQEIQKALEENPLLERDEEMLQSLVKLCMNAPYTVSLEIKLQCFQGFLSSVKQFHEKKILENVLLFIFHYRLR